MKTRVFWRLDDVSDARLVGTLKGLLADGCRIEARVVAHLAELDARRLHLRGGQSLFEYCQVRLGFSDSQAYYRINAARVARRFPIVFELLERHEIHLTAIAYIGQYLTEENHAELLQEVCRKTKRQILELIVRRFPKADVASEVRRLPVHSGAVAAGPTGTLEPRSAESYRLQLNIDAETLEELELARDLMSHANPSGDLAVVVKRGLKLLVQTLKRERFGQTKRPRKPTRQCPVAAADSQYFGQPKLNDGGSLSEPENMGGDEPRMVGGDEPRMMGGDEPSVRRRVANAVRRRLLARDGLRCSYVGDDGCRCSSRAFLQIDHQRAWAKGGLDTLDNLRLLCASHNHLLAEQEFGVTKVAYAIEQRRQRRGGHDVNR